MARALGTTVLFLCSVPSAWGQAPTSPVQPSDTLNAPPHARRAGNDWWSLQPVVRAAVPVVKNSAWPGNALDHFVLAALEAKGLAPAPEADRATLIRRLTFDLIGLPPTAGEVAAFARDERPDAANIGVRDCAAL